MRCPFNDYESQVCKYPSKHTVIQENLSSFRYGIVHIHLIGCRPKIHRDADGTFTDFANEEIESSLLNGTGWLVNMITPQDRKLYTDLQILFKEYSNTNFQNTKMEFNHDVRKQIE